MKEIKNLEKITSIYSGWKPTDVAFLKSLEWSFNNLLIVFYCQLRENVNGWPDTSSDFFELAIKFKNVSNLKIDFNNSKLQQISGFDILDISDTGLEKVNFQIEDYEDNTIYFFCEEIEIVNVSNLEKIIVI